MALLTLLQVLNYLTSILITLVIIQFVISLLVAFNVISMSNQFVSGIMQALNTILDPLLRPIRKILPDTGMIDFSPMVLIIALNILNIVLRNLALAAY